MNVNDIYLIWKLITVNMVFFPFIIAFALLRTVLRKLFILITQIFLSNNTSAKKNPFILKVSLLVLFSSKNCKILSNTFKDYLRCQITFLTLSICILYRHTHNGSCKRTRKTIWRNNAWKVLHENINEKE